MTRNEIFREAEKCVCGSRQQDYGNLENNFETISSFWTCYLGAREDVLPIEPHDVAAMMILLKIARIASGHAKEDNWIDIAGYAACGGELQK